MNRRKFIVLSGITIGTTTSLSGCLEDITGALNIRQLDVNTTSLGGIQLQIIVENNSQSRKEGQLYGEVDIDGGDTLMEHEQISVGAEQQNSYTLGFSPNISERLSEEEFTYDAWIKR